MDDEKTETTAIIINEVQLLLAEKRTSLSVMRTGITVLVLPVSVLSLLVATSKYYVIIHVMHFLIPLSLLILALIAFGTYLIVRSINRMRHYDQLISKIKQKHSIVAEFLD